MTTSLTALPDADGDTMYHRLNLAGVLAGINKAVTADPFDYEGMEPDSLNIVGGLLEYLSTLTMALAWRDQAAKLAADGLPVPAAPADIPTGRQLERLAAVTDAAIDLYRAWDLGADIPLAAA